MVLKSKFIIGDPCAPLNSLPVALDRKFMFLRGVSHVPSQISSLAWTWLDVCGRGRRKNGAQLLFLIQS